jgi:alpha-L-fucosidase
LLCLSAALLAAAFAAAARQLPGAAVVPENAPPDSVAAIAARVTPTARQLAWQERETIAFLHFGMNTFTGREWGLGTEDPSLFNPTDFDAAQWAATLKASGFTTAILTAKHHDGFCLWPSRFTDHSVRRSPWRGGGGDVVREVADACRAAGIKFGIYLSPWDRHEPSYGDSARYNQYFRNQLRELLTGYGDIAEVWFDGANGEGAGGRRQAYDWPSYYRVIRELQPGAVIFGMGPDVRWVGTESGVGRETEWSVVPFTFKVPAGGLRGDHPLDDLFTPGDLMGDDLGSRGKLRAATVLAWYPAETDVSIRPGWFYHPAEDARVKSAEELADLYYTSVGRNSVLLLNIPPDARGRIADADRASLLDMRRILDQTFAVNLLAGARLTASSSAAGHPVENIADSSAATSWLAAAAGEAAVTIEFPGTVRFDRLLLQEDVREGQRIEEFRLEAFADGAWQSVAAGTTVGAKRLLRFPAVSAKRVRLVLAQSRSNPTLASMGLYLSPPVVAIQPDGATFVDSVRVSIAADRPGAAIRYTLDGSAPGPSSMLYHGPLVVTRDAKLTASATDSRGVESALRSARFHRATVGLRLRTPCSPKYSGGGPLALVDGERASGDPADPHWVGFEGDDLDAVVDLGSPREITGVSAGFLSKEHSWIFPPDSVSYFVSNDGERFVPLATVRDAAPGADGVRSFAAAPAPVRARYVRVLGASIGVCPPGHPGAGKKCWLFVDEISILTR